MTTTTAEPKEAAGDLPDGLNHRRGVEYLAAAAGMKPDQLGAAAIFDERIGFSEITAFIKSSDGRGYWMTTLNECSCPDWRYRKAGTGKLCKHQERLAEVLKARGTASLPSGVVGMTSEELAERADRIAARNARQAEERARRAAAVSPSRRGFNNPGEVEA